MGERRSKRGRGAEPRDDPAVPSPPSDAPRGLRVFRRVVAGVEHAVLVLPARARVEHSHAMTAAEREVVALVLEGLSNEAIAARRGTSARTVANQLQSIYRKLGVGSRLELVHVLGRRS